MAVSPLAEMDYCSVKISYCPEGNWINSYRKEFRKG